MLKFCSPLILLMCAPAGASHAEEDLLQLDLPMVVSASRITQSILSSPSPVTVIDEHMIAASAYTDIADILRLVPGFQVVKADGRTFSVNSHGGGWEFSNRMQVLVNGRAAYLPTLSVVDWDTLGVHIDDIERIEVVRGASASAYGSNSFAAAINIITKPAAIDNRFSVSTRVGNDGEREVVGRYAGQSDAFAYRVSMWQRRSNGLDGYHDFRKHNNFAFSGRLNLQDGGELDIELNAYGGRTGSGEFFELEPTDRKVNGFSSKLAWTKPLGQQEELRVQLYYSDRDEDDLTSTIPLPEILGISQEQFEAATGTSEVIFRTGYSTHKARRLDAESQYSWFNDSGLKAVVGLGLRQDFLKSISYFPQKGEIEDTSYRVFANAQQALGDKVSLNAGVLYEHTADEHGHWSPRASVNWSFLEKQSLRLTVSKAYRLASLLEANFDTQTILSNGLVLDYRYRSDDDISAESVLNYSIGYQGQYKEWLWELNVYQERYEDLIRFVNDDSVVDILANGVRRVGNYDSYDTQGVEGELMYRPKLDTFVRLHFNKGSSRQQALKSFAPRYSYSSGRSPDTSVGLMAAIPFAHWQFGLSMQYMGNIDWDGFGDRVKSYTRFDTSIGRSWLVGNQELKFKVGALSFNRSYHEFNRDLFIQPQYYFSVSLGQR